MAIKIHNHDSVTIMSFWVRCGDINPDISQQKYPTGNHTQLKTKVHNCLADDTNDARPAGENIFLVRQVGLEIFHYGRARVLFIALEHVPDHQRQVVLVYGRFIRPRKTYQILRTFVELVFFNHNFFSSAS